MEEGESSMLPAAPPIVAIRPNNRGPLEVQRQIVVAYAGSQGQRVDLEADMREALTALPGEINVSVRYNSGDVSGLNEQNLTLSRLNPTTNQWQAATKLYKDADSNYIAASVMDVGAYVVHAP